MKARLSARVVDLAPDGTEDRLVGGDPAVVRAPESGAPPRDAPESSTAALLSCEAAFLPSSPTFAVVCEWGQEHSLQDLRYLAFLKSARPAAQAAQSCPDSPSEGLD